ncbi:MAG: tripartite tricarboxylate transporter substrate binding protein [Betaproteobacteria bacterium]|nr:tripartite tricarboxylate transporter substrate binding protein [Betaproteobacteria bacterium]
MRAVLLWCMAGSLAAWCVERPAHAQPVYPQKPVRLLVGFVPGGVTDLLARVLGQKLSQTLRQRIVVENRPGANQVVAAELTISSAPDGYTLLMASAGLTITPHLRKKPPFDPVRHFSQISLVAIVPNVLVVHPSLPARSVKELIALARLHPGRLTLASAGVGSPGHLSGKLLKVLTRMSFVHVPYKGSGQAFGDLITGQVQLSFPTIPAAIPHIEAGKLRALAVTTPKRSSSLPAVPTIGEAGVKGYEVTGWYGVVGPANIPRDVVLLIKEELVRALQSPDVRDLLLSKGAEPVGSTPEEFSAVIAADSAKWGRVVKAIGLEPD